LIEDIADKLETKKKLFDDDEAQNMGNVDEDDYERNN